MRILPMENTPDAHTLSTSYFIISVSPMIFEYIINLDMLNLPVDGKANLYRRNSRLVLLFLTQSQWFYDISHNISINQ